MSDYNPHSVDATLSRIETKLDAKLAEVESRQIEHDRQLGKLWAALGRLDVRVAVIAATISTAFAILKLVAATLK